MKQLKFGLAESADEMPQGDNWVFQPKLDGVRSLAVDGELFNRPSGSDEPGKNITPKFPELNPPEGVVLDGEIVAEGGFGNVMRRVQVEDEFDIELRSKSIPVEYVAFDVLAIGDRDVRSHPLRERLEILEEIESVKTIRTVEDGEKLFEEMVEKGGEGILAKRVDAPYPEGRGRDWLKIKNWEEETFSILGYEVTEKGGFVIKIPVEGDVQRVVVNGERDQEAIEEMIEDGEEPSAEIQYLSKDEGSLRAPSFKRLLG